ncbi:uncharacterized protein B0P05DRAFT_553556 [Gilbertella persicaria]|uniref:uncharacterized protein n=1 Tax=Gilbertella persicaria TaxID=101096 RepID=UPI002220CC04|nr:uncharacterized protein B0P05DRAFT_553556 [Gilbertella persicaria]KAI8066248.1 hypothetical protein B0P05DRAFT_553556 [Gilbertella persicaria]
MLARPDGDVRQKAVWHYFLRVRKRKQAIPMDKTVFLDKYFLFLLPCTAIVNNMSLFFVSNVGFGNEGL